ncbi:hypothetical protein [Streptomyces boncukensis]|uniref:Serine/threonine protein kinase n=1 Tax=Streptomyces boncukensis TaxID=2711219 RepID=A0A6G4X3F1_9ACTN|nr:hypothetical protein [Streptomyces boncukensis]NGO72035.1 hypothetical protein [Streptomyces boncukensis]
MPSTQDDGGNEGDKSSVAQTKGGSGREESDSPSAPPSPSDSPSDSPSAGAGDGIPDRFLGTWTSHLPGKPNDTRRMVIQQAKPGETAMTLTADGSSYHCVFQAELASVTGDAVELKATEVTVGPETSCSAGQATTLVPAGDKLRRENADGTPPLTYTRVG